jgi:undecaprenyl-diphosphatase
VDIIHLIKVIILGIVEGLTEFAPVSSTGHMIIVDDVWLKSQEFLTAPVANTFKVVIQLGSILAVVVMFWGRFMELLGLHWLAGKRWTESRDGQSGAHEQGEHEANSGKRLKLGQVIVGLLPAGILGVLTERFIDQHLFTTTTVLGALVAGALLMIAADRFAPAKPKAETVDQITYKQALTIGLIQCLSLWPGFSRSGATISGGVLTGLSHRAAADFTFIMAVPIMAGASLISLMGNWEYFSVDVLPYFIGGFISAFIVALLAIRFFLRLINRIKLLPFALYRIVLAVVIYFVFFM